MRGIYFMLYTRTHTQSSILYIDVYTISGHAAQRKRARRGVCTIIMRIYAKYYNHFFSIDTRVCLLCALMVCSRSAHLHSCALVWVCVCVCVCKRMRTRKFSSRFMANGKTGSRSFAFASARAFGERFK